MHGIGVAVVEGMGMEERLSRTYNPIEHEERLYGWWEEQGFFRPEAQVKLGLASADGPRWCITMPPPNVTGALHLGHAMTAAVEDLMTRYNRMRGRQTLYLPGSDHAGIANQAEIDLRDHLALVGQSLILGDALVEIGRGQEYARPGHAEQDHGHGARLGLCNHLSQVALNLD